MIYSIGTDCSGIEAPLQALIKINKKFIHEFSCEIDKYAIESIRANYEPKILYKDMNDRIVADMPDIDIYVCGFPCQPFSLAGDRKGTTDSRGIIFFKCLEVIQIKKPKFFILENVSGLLSCNKGELFKSMTILLKENEDYEIHYSLLNALDYGIPQSRKRIFIIGIKKSLVKRCFLFPKKQSYNPLIEYVDDNDDTQNISQTMLNKINTKVPTNSLFIDLSFIGCTNFPNSNKFCPCISKQSKIICVPKQRKANKNELLSLMGFPTTFKQVVSDSQFHKQIGNSMVVNVVAELFIEIFKCIE